MAGTHGGEEGTQPPPFPSQWASTLASPRNSGRQPDCEASGPAPARPVSAHLLCPALVRSLVLVVDPAEVGDDHGHRQGDDQDAAQGADGPEDLPGDRLGHHVPVAEGGEQV